MTRVTKVQALNPAEIDCVSGGTDVPPQFGFWEDILPILIPGARPPWFSVDADPVPGTPQQL